jgi:two-component system response regulator HydG
MSTHRVLIVDDDPSSLEAMRLVVHSLGHGTDEASTAEAAEQLIARQPYDLVITDMMLPGETGMELLKRLRGLAVPPAVILVTGHATLDTAVAALKWGAVDYLTKPVDPTALKAAVRAQMANAFAFELADADGLVAQSRTMKQVLERLSNASETEAPVLLFGEGGTGKELCAAWVHQRSARREGPFTTFHAGALPVDTVGIELFGSLDHPGRIETARGGTLFLDDLEVLDAPTQLALVRMLETGRFRRAGEQEERMAEARLVAATSRDLATLSAAGAFREDLYYRMSVMQVALPPLRDRREDIAPLARRFVALFAAHYRKVGLTIGDSALTRLSRHAWPGNVRELRNAVEQAVILCQGLEITPDLLPQPAQTQADGPSVLRIPIGTAIKDVEREMIVRTLDANRGNKNRTARQLGISRRSLYNKLERYQIAAPPRTP